MDIDDVINEVNDLDSDSSLSSDISKTSKNGNLLKYNVTLEKKETKEVETQCQLDKELIIPLDVYNLRNIVFAGGGARIFSHFGFIKALEEHDLMKNIVNFAGTSIGSLTAFCIILGYTVEQMIHIFTNIDLLKTIDINADSIFNYFTNLGLDNGDRYVRIINILIKKKIDRVGITFKELYELTGKKLAVSVTNISKMHWEIFDKDNNPDMEIALAIRMSCCYPYFLTPIKHNDCLYIDGGVLNNYPINYFNSDIDRTIGISNYTCEDGDTKIEIEDILSFTLSILNSMSVDKQRDVTNMYANNTVLLECMTEPINFTLTLEEKQTMVEEGYTATIKFLEKYILKE
tara:strand:- start:949 stop:1986 length:1038 start_codon:yes stop_codon:yes gene_type:complete